jgi:hypothetical protein
MHNIYCFIAQLLQSFFTLLLHRPRNTPHMHTATDSMLSSSVPLSLLPMLNYLVDNLILVYAAVVLVIIFSFWLYKGRKGKEQPTYDRNRTKKATHVDSPKSVSVSGDVKHGNNDEDGDEDDWEDDWQSLLQGRWKQVESDNLDNFGMLSNQSKLRRTVGALAFYRVRHKISFERLSGGSGGSDTDGARFCLLRDLGEGLQEWTLEAVIGTSRDSAEVVERKVDTPGEDKVYRYRLWVDKAVEGKRGGELLMESEPAVLDADSIKTLQVRSLVGRNRMKMVIIIIIRNNNVTNV